MKTQEKLVNTSLGPRMIKFVVNANSWSFGCVTVCRIRDNKLVAAEQFNCKTEKRRALLSMNRVVTRRGDKKTLYYVSLNYGVYLKEFIRNRKIDVK